MHVTLANYINRCPTEMATIADACITVICRFGESRSVDMNETSREISCQSQPVLPSKWREEAAIELSVVVLWT